MDEQASKNHRIRSHVDCEDFTEHWTKIGRQKGSQRGECYILVLIQRFGMVMRSKLWLHCLVIDA